MTSELLAVIEYFEKEKGIDRATMVEALESALLSASKKSVGPARELRIEVDPVKVRILVDATPVERKFEEVSIVLDGADYETARCDASESRVGQVGQPRIQAGGLL